jgi:hypothetical protein
MSIQSRNELTFLFVDGSIHPRKKMTGNCIIARSADSKLPYIISVWMDTLSKNKTNKFIPYH